jgi:hypothetical protein
MVHIRLFPGAVLHPEKHCTGIVKVIYNPVVWDGGWQLASWTDGTASTVNDFQLPHSFDRRYMILTQGVDLPSPSKPVTAGRNNLSIENYPLLPTEIGLVARCHSFYLFYINRVILLVEYHSCFPRSLRSVEGLRWGAEPRFELLPRTASRRATI